MGYYDYGPLVTLPRSLSLIGFLGAGTLHLGHSLASNLGLPLIDVDRRIEHHAGMSLSQLQLQRGESVRRQWEHWVLRKAVREQPYGIIVLGDGALLQAESSLLVTEHTLLLYLERPMEYLQRAIAHERTTHPARYPELALPAHTPPTTAQLSSLLEVRSVSYRAATRVLHGGYEHPTKICQRLQRELQLDYGTAE